MTGGLVAVGRLPLARHVHFTSRDFDEMHDRLCRVLKPHALNRLPSRAPVAGRIHRAEVGRLTFNVLRIGPAVDVFPESLESFYLIQLPVRGTVQLAIGEEMLACRGADGVVLSPEMPLRLRWSDDCTQVLVQIERERLERHLAKRLGAAPKQALRFAPRLDLCSGVGAVCRRLVESVFESLDGDDALAGRGAFAADLERLLMSALLHGQPSNYSEALERAAGAAIPYYVRRADRHMTEALDGALSVGDLARAAGVSERTLHEGFRQVYGTTPMRRLKRLRLEAARAALETADPAATSVSEIAARFGFFQFGRFAGDYRRAFGERPSDTLQRR
jgi:AraC-like DNA-binding protein